MQIPRAVRTTILWMHLLTGVIAGLVVFIMSVTGVLLAYERQMIEWADGFSVAPPTADAKPVSVETILANVRTALPEATVSNVSLNADPYKPATVRSGRTTIFVDPYTGEVLGEGNPKMRAFISSLRGWHRWLALSGEHRDYGKAITGAANLGFLFLVMSGFYLWWPRRWTWKVVKPVVIPSSKLKGKPRDFNWHNSLGFWAAIPLFFIVLTGVFISYRWPRELTDKLLGGRTATQSREGGLRQGSAGEGRGGERPREPLLEFPAGKLDHLVAEAQRRAVGWKTLSVSLPHEGDKNISVTINRSENPRPDTREQLKLKVEDGKFAGLTMYSDGPLSRRLTSWVRYLHTGEVFGVFGQTIAMLASLVGAVLVWTGLALTWRRFRAWRNRRDRPERLMPDEAAVA
jgi:uncharacterized iron-regulated membrane protein